MLSDFSDDNCNALIDFFQLLALVFRVTDGVKVMCVFPLRLRSRFCCSPLVLNLNYDCLLFDPKAMDLKQPFYQQQVLISRFYSFLRCVGARGASER